ncbi:Imm1 family immunity protein [Amycolatopsis suaedae]|uniref:Uncharacterized protein n=1 Tax=Amycolatopsis suaedae TaxID=2510978 RepID=A0A4Q7J8I0_9PSEU|nr:Imm1 family immunity protein [Amycolatopsis suaedae]RZQ62683.1 hypothetical protein EWH70_17125 [Amycolatopsis suaedae]
MNYTAAIPTGYGRGERLVLDSDEAVNQLITLLSRAGTHDASIQGDDATATLDVQIHDGFGYLLYAGENMYGFSVGEPGSPDLRELSEVGFPAGSGVGLTRFRQAIVQFVRTGGALPDAVGWRPVEEFAG